MGLVAVISIVLSPGIIRPTSPSPSPHRAGFQHPSVRRCRGQAAAVDKGGKEELSPSGTPRLFSLPLSLPICFFFFNHPSRANPNIPSPRYRTPARNLTKSSTCLPSTLPTSSSPWSRARPAPSPSSPYVKASPCTTRPLLPRVRVRWLTVTCCLDHGAPAR